MSNLGPDQTNGLLPQTVQQLREKEAAMHVLCDVLTEFFSTLGAPLDISISATATMLARLVMIPDPRENFARKTASLRGVAQALEAYCDAPTHEAGCTAMAAAGARANRGTFERMDVDIATKAAPRN